MAFFLLTSNVRGLEKTIQIDDVNSFGYNTCLLYCHACDTYYKVPIRSDMYTTIQELVAVTILLIAVKQSDLIFRRILRLEWAKSRIGSSRFEST